MEVKECPICKGGRFICIGINNDLSPILVGCYSCYGKGWVQVAGSGWIPLEVNIVGWLVPWDGDRIW